MSAAFDVVPIVSKSHARIPVAAALRVLAAPDWAHVITLKRRAELADVLGGEASERTVRSKRRAMSRSPWSLKR